MIETEKLANTVVRTLDKAKGEKITKIDLRKNHNCFCDFFIISHGNSNTHVASLAKKIEESVFDELHEKPIRVQGLNNSEWVIVDYSDVIVHIFQEEVRYKYKLEELWGDGIISNYEGN